MQRIIMADGHERSWIVLDANGRPITEVNKYVLYLHQLGRSPNTVRAYAHHLQVFHEFLADTRGFWKKLAPSDLATFVGWLRLSSRKVQEPRCDSTINVVLAVVGSFYEYQDRLDVETEISRSCRFGAKSSYKPFLHHITRTQSLRQAVMRVRTTKLLPKALTAADVQRLLDACIHLRHRLLLCLVYESGMPIGQVLGL